MNISACQRHAIYILCIHDYTTSDHEAVVPQLDYVVIFDVRAEVVNVVGVFHQLESYQSKL